MRLLVALVAALAALSVASAVKASKKKTRATSHALPGKTAHIKKLAEQVKGLSRTTGKAVDNLRASVTKQRLASLKGTETEKSFMAALQAKSKSKSKSISETSEKKLGGSSLRGEAQQPPRVRELNHEPPYSEAKISDYSMDYKVNLMEYGAEGCAGNPFAVSSYTMSECRSGESCYNDAMDYAPYTPFNPYYASCRDLVGEKTGEGYKMMTLFYEDTSACGVSNNIDEGKDRLSWSTEWFLNLTFAVTVSNRTKIYDNGTVVGVSYDDYVIIPTTNYMKYYDGACVGPDDLFFEGDYYDDDYTDDDDDDNYDDDDDDDDDYFTNFTPKGAITVTRSITFEWSLVAVDPSMLDDKAYLTRSTFSEMTGIAQCEANRGPTTVEFYAATCSAFQFKDNGTAFDVSSSFAMQGEYVTQTLYYGDACKGSPIFLNYITTLGCVQPVIPEDDAEYINPINVYEDDADDDDDPGTANYEAVRYEFTAADPTCQAGTYETGAGCVACPAGTYSSTDGLSCMSCAAGKYSSAFSSQCWDCAAGYYSVNGASTCTQCASGSVSAAGSSKCTVCATGMSAPYPAHQRPL